MSYNIDQFKVKKLEGLTLPLSALKDIKVFREHLEIKHDLITDVISITGGCNQEILAKPVPGNAELLQITGFGHMTDDGSGNFYQECLLPALRQSTGTLEVVTVWEGGDSISRLTVSDGTIKDEQVEL